MEESELEKWKDVSYRIREEGITYCFDGYSRWENIKDKKFHKLRQQYLKISKELKQYVEDKKIEAEEEEFNKEFGE